MDMKTITRADWTAALRSGDYKQGRGQLRDMKPGYEAFCCLGVACAIAELPLPPGKDSWATNTPNGLLPEPLDGMLQLHPRAQWYLSQQNDNQRLTFEEVADLIDRLPTYEPDNVRVQDFVPELLPRAVAIT